MKINGDKIFIVGGRGYIGSALLLALAKHYPIVCLDNEEKHSSLPAMVPPTVKFITGNLIESSQWEEAIQDCSIIMNFAGGGGNKRALHDPFKAYQAYVSGTKNLLEKAAKCGIRHIYLSSTIAVYPEKEDVLTEKTEPRPKDYYSALKLISEYLLIESGLPGTIMRLTNIYGYTPFYPMQEGGALGNFIRAAVKGDDMIVYGDGNEKIEYLHICDLISAIMLFLKRDSEQNKMEIFNIGYGEAISVQQLAAVVLAECWKMFYSRSQIRMEREKITQGVAGDRPISIDKIKKRINWSPRVSLQEGIIEILVKYSGKKEKRK